MDFFKVEARPSETSGLMKGTMAQPVISRSGWSGEFFDKSYDSTYVYLSEEKKKRLRLDRAKVRIACLASALAQTARAPPLAVYTEARAGDTWW